MEKLSDFTRQIVHSKAMDAAADRLIALGLRQAPALIRKGTVSAVTTADAPAFLADPESTTLISVVQRQNILGRLATLGAVSVPVNQQLPFGDTDPQPVWTAEGAPRPVGRFTTTATATTATSYALLMVFTREYLKLGDPRSRNLVLSRSVRGLARADDTVFVSDDAATAASPAGILFGRSPIGAGSPGDLQSDLENLYAAVSDGRPFSPVFLLSGRGAVYLSASDGQAFKDLRATTGGSIAGIPAVISPAAGANLILLDASELAFSDGGVDVTTSEHAALQMSDTPTPGPVQMTSMFQSNSIALRFERFLSWVLLREDACGFIQLPVGGSPQ